jgi:hypothetical protein
VGGERWARERAEGRGAAQHSLTTLLQLQFFWQRLPFARCCSKHMQRDRSC